MLLEILVDKSNPVVHPLKGSKIILGSSEKCDIVINAVGVSRKHICITVEGDHFSVVDLGSTNGSFINENRLIPGRKTEFTTFFPLRLGSNVLISLLSDEDYESKINLPSSPREPRSDNITKTTVISLKDLNKAKTEKLINMRDEKRAQIQGKGPKKVLKKKKVNIVPFMAISLIVVTGVYNFSMVEEEKVEDYPEVGQIVKRSDESKMGKSNEGVEDLIAENELPSLDYFSRIKNEMKCISDMEKSLCSYLPGLSSSSFGVTQIGLSLYALVDGTDFITRAKNLFLNQPEGSAIVTDNELIGDTAIYLYLIEALKKDLDISNLKDVKLFIALYEKSTESEDRLHRVVALRPAVINNLRPFVVEQNIHFIKTGGKPALGVTKRFYRTF